MPGAFPISISFLFLSLPATFAADVRGVPQSGYRDWRMHGGAADNIRYSALSQINRENAHRLQPAWTFDSGDAFPGSEMQANPIVVGATLYATTPKLRVVALDAATGRLKWSFDPTPKGATPGKLRNRGLTYWPGGNRLYVAREHWMYALDAETGKPVESFGESGRIDLREHLGRPPETMVVGCNTPPVIYKDLLIVGTIVSEGLPAAPGDIRGYELKSGKLRWTFHTIPHPGEYGYDTWPKDAWTYIGGANAWAGLTLDEQRGIVYAPTGSAASDFFGANRVGDNLFANTLLALDASTGKRLWHFQAVRHDIWDRDFPAAPSLVRIRRNGAWVDAVAQIAKSGHVWVFERATGKPVFGVEERDVPPSLVPGEVAAKRQRLPLAPPPFARQRLTADMLSNRTPEINRLLRERFSLLRSDGQFVPGSFEGTVIFPGYDGGGEWGGATFDPETGLLYVNANEMAWILRLKPRGVSSGRLSAQRLYAANCAACHRDDRKGSPPEFPALLDLAKSRSEAEVAAVIAKGRGRMPGFGATLKPAGVSALASYLMTGENRETEAAAKLSPIDQAYTHDGYNKFLDPEGYPAVAPPWGTLTAINLDEGRIAWQIPFGETKFGNTGSENYGGGVVTAGGVFFIGATNHDRKFRVMDKSNGKVLWETVLPAAGNATPAVYEVNGRQYVVIGAGGGKWGNISGGSYHAFALPAE